jgi:hypothetical protein
MASLNSNIIREVIGVLVDHNFKRLFRDEKGFSADTHLLFVSSYRGGKLYGQVPIDARNSTTLTYMRKKNNIAMKLETFSFDTLKLIQAVGRLDEAMEKLEMNYE